MSLLRLMINSALRFMTRPVTLSHGSNFSRWVSADERAKKGNRPAYATMDPNLKQAKEALSRLK